MSRTCSKCKIHKEISFFHRDCKQTGGHKYKCKDCTKVETYFNYKNNREKELLKVKNWQAANKEKIKLRERSYRTKNKVEIAARCRSWRKRYPYKINALVRKREQQKRHAAPKWLDEKHLEQIQDLYLEAFILTQETEVRHEVDHIVPLQGKNVCGLHVPWNLQVITKTANIKKGNKF